MSGNPPMFAPSGPMTRDEFYRLTELGYFNGKRVELIGGEITEMAAQSNWHAVVIKAAEKALEAAFGPNYWVRVQNTLDLSPLSVPDPDLAVIEGGYETHLHRDNPRTAVLIVEVSETTLDDDRGRKSGLYAAAGIEDYWIINIPQRQLEIRRTPAPDATEPFGFGYATETVSVVGDVVSPLALPTARIAVADLIPI